MRKQEKPQNPPKTDKTIRFFEKYMLTQQEACLYFHIGEKKMKEILDNNDGAKWMLYSGARVMIKRELFAKWLDQQLMI